MAQNEILQTEYLIIGNSAGGIGAAEAIRDVDKHGSITMVSEEPYPVYSRPLISKYLANERDIEGILFRSRDFYCQNDINLISGKRVNHLDPIQNIAQLYDGQQVIWQKVLLATGGVPIVPRINNIGKKGVFNFLTIKDADDIAAFIEPGKKALVIGGGLIGVSVTEALQKRRLNVTIVEMKNRVLNTILDEEGSSIVEHTLNEAGVEIITNHTVSGITGDTVVEGIILDNGEEIPCNLVVLAIGVMPRVELVIGTEIKVNRGIVVDRFMATNLPNVYACGDVAEAYDFIDDSNRVIPVWPNAYMGGRIAGNNMAGVRTEYSGGTAMNSLNYFGIDIATAGIVTTPDNKQYETIIKRDNGSYKKLTLNNDNVVGMVFIGDIEKSGIIFSLIRERINASSFKKELLSDNFGLAYLPSQIWQDRLGISLQNRTFPDKRPDENVVPPLTNEQSQTGALK